MRQSTLTLTPGQTRTLTLVTTFGLEPANRAPDPLEDEATTPEDTSVDIDVLANDDDPDGGELTLVDVTPPDQGTATIVGGLVRYTPNPNFHGTDTFEYTVEDELGEPATATVTVIVTPVPDAPVAANDAYATDEDVQLTVPAEGVLTNDTDADGDPLSAVKVTDPAHGTLDAEHRRLVHLHAGSELPRDRLVHLQGDRRRRLDSQRRAPCRSR